MQIQRVRGRDLHEALRRAQELVGAEALVLSQETMPDGGVTVAVTLDRAQTPENKRKHADPGLGDVERALTRSGCTAAWISRVVELVADARRVDPRTEAPHQREAALDAAARVLGQSVSIATSPKLAARPQVIALVGSAGVGKTTTVAKLAAHFARAGRRVGLVSLDVDRPGALEPLARLASLIQAPFDLAADGAALHGALERSLTRDVVLVDTSGSAATDARALIALGDDFALSTYLVAAATMSRVALEETARAFATTRFSALVISKLDETRAPAAALEFAAQARISLALLCDGRDLGAHLHRADAERVADLFLRGRLER